MKKYLAAALMLCLLLSGCSAGSDVPADQATVPEEEIYIEPAEETPAPMAEVEIGVRIDKSGEYTDSVDNYRIYSYRLPVLTGAETELTRRVNNDMEMIIREYIEPELESMRGGYSLVTCRAGFEYCVNGDIISLIATVYSDWEQQLFFIYNFDRYGNEVSNIDVLAAAGYTPEEFLVKAEDRLNSYFSVFDIPDELLEGIELCREKTIAPENCNLNMPLYFGVDGMLCFAARTYSIAGADSYNHIFVLTDEDGFNENQLSSLALSYYERCNNYRPQYGAAAIEGDSAVIQLYDQVEDHNSTADWFTVNPFSGVGTDISGFPIDISCR